MIDSAAQVLAAATALIGDPERAAFWFRTQGVAEFGGKTAEELVEEGCVTDVLKYIEMLEAGFCG